MQKYRKAFDAYMGVKSEPNAHELVLFDRAKEYIAKICNIPGIEIVAVCNSLSMYATHKDSDIDLFIVTKPSMLWFVRFFVTLRFWQLGVWRKGEDIAGNFCLSFFVTSDALDLSKIAIANDIYLYYWIYYLKPILNRNGTYEKFIEVNNWVKIDQEQKEKNQEFRLNQIDNVAVQKGESQNTGSLRTSRGRNQHGFLRIINSVIRFFLKRKTLKQYHTLGKPEGVIITDDVLKFHDQDQRQRIRDAILRKNFDK